MQKIKMYDNYDNNVVLKNQQRSILPCKCFRCTNGSQI